MATYIGLCWFPMLQAIGVEGEILSLSYGFRNVFNRALGTIVFGIKLH